MFGRHRALLERHIGPLLFFNSDLGSRLSRSISLFFSKTARRCSDPVTDLFFCCGFEVSGLSEVFKFCHFFNFFPDQFCHFFNVFLINSNIFTVCTACHVFSQLSGQLSAFLSSGCLSAFPFCLSIEISNLANLNFERFPPSTLFPSEIYAFLKTFSITTVNSLGEAGPPCLTPLFTGNLPDTNLSKRIVAVAWLKMFCNFLRMFRLC